MEMTLNMGAFEALDQQELMEVDGGYGKISTAWMAVGTAGVVVGTVTGFAPLAAAGALICGAASVLAEMGY